MRHSANIHAGLAHALLSLSYHSYSQALSCKIKLALLVGIAVPLVVAAELIESGS